MARQASSDERGMCWLVVGLGILLGAVVLFMLGMIGLQVWLLLR